VFKGMSAGYLSTAGQVGIDKHQSRGGTMSTFIARIIEPTKKNGRPKGGGKLLGAARTAHAGPGRRR
jgi:hypothetical protein